ncbi:MAG: cysteine desulfurase NifS [Abditibacteriota bacterium]|nr:cysteine desulfurase NifS [Abditibacteriota bacterium]
MNKIVYMDHAATTALDPKVLEVMMPYLTYEYGNAGGIYSLGRNAGEAVHVARAQLANLLNSTPDEIYFTSGGTESDNWAIKGVCDARKKYGNHIITTAIEHHAVLETCKYMEKHGYEVTYIPVDENGLVNPKDIEQAITDKTILVTCMHANNEIGTIEPVEEIGKICNDRHIHFHVDAVQTTGHIEVDVERIGCNSLALSSHKFYGPKGVGAMYLKKGSVCTNFMLGGGQENNRRASTHNVAGIVGLGKASELALLNMNEEYNQTIILRDKLIKTIEETIPDCKLNGDRVKRLPNNINFIFKGIEGESLILFLDMAGVCASSGSACTSGSLDPSHVLLAIGLKHEEAHGSLRLTLGKDNTEEDINLVAEKLPGIVNRLREMSPLYNK